MSIANDLNDVVEASGDMLARLAILPTIFPTNGLLPLPPCLKRPLSADAAYLLIWSCGSSWGWPFSAMSPSPRSLGASTSVQKGWPMMPCSRTVPCLRPVSDSANSRSVAVQTVRRCVGAGTLS